MKWQVPVDTGRRQAKRLLLALGLPYCGALPRQRPPLHSPVSQLLTGIAKKQSSAN